MNVFSGTVQMDTRGKRSAFCVPDVMIHYQRLLPLITNPIMKFLWIWPKSQPGFREEAYRSSKSRHKTLKTLIQMFEFENASFGFFKSVNGKHFEKELSKMPTL